MFYFEKLLSKRSVLACLFGTFFLTACKPHITESVSSQKYFDLTGFFKLDTAKLNQLNLRVLKSVTHNNNTESKTVLIRDWGRELYFFLNSDINKPAWRNSYTITRDSDFLLYKAKDPDLKMREMLIKQDKGAVKWILIFNRTRNKLYQSLEKLTYYPDSLYIIEKSQRVRFLGINNYKIQGLIKK